MSKLKRKRSEDNEEILSLVKELSDGMEEVKNKVSSLTMKLLKLKKIIGGEQITSSSVVQYSSVDATETDGLNIYDGNQINFTKENGYVVVYTDGACENNGKPIAKAGIGVYFGAGCPLNLSQPVIGRATNNTAEIQACVHAIKIAHKHGVRRLKIKTDSNFVIKSITEWIHKWKKNNWKVATGKDVINKDDFIILDSARKLLDDIQWEHVDGHKGIVGNEEADKLARNGAQLYKN